MRTAHDMNVAGSRLQQGGEYDVYVETATQFIVRNWLDQFGCHVETATQFIAGNWLDQLVQYACSREVVITPECGRGAEFSKGLRVAQFRCQGN